MLVLFSKGVDAADDYSLADVLERLYQNQLGLEAALMELTLRAEQQGLVEVGDNAVHIKQGLARLKGKSLG